MFKQSICQVGKRNEIDYYPNSISLVLSIKILICIQIDHFIVGIILNREMNNFFIFSVLFAKIIPFSSSNIIPKNSFSSEIH